MTHLLNLNRLSFRIEDVWDDLASPFPLTEEPEGPPSCGVPCSCSSVGEPGESMVGYIRPENWSANEVDAMKARVRDEGGNERWVAGALCALMSGGGEMESHKVRQAPECGERSCRRV